MPVVWLHDPDDTTHYWERDWLRYLLGGLPVAHRHAVDTGSAPVGNALVIFGNDIAQPAVQAYLNAYKRANCRHGLIHLSDEFFTHDISCYTSAAVVFRTCYRPAAPHNTFGLGYKQGFWDAYTGPSSDARTVTDRAYAWSFAGDLAKSDRPEMMAALRSISGHFVHPTSFWNSPDCLPTPEYRDLLLNTVFVPSPMGDYSLDCFRTYEALEAGCIPVVLRQTAAQPFDYYGKLFGAMGFAEPVPFLQVSDWRQAATRVTHLLKDRENLEGLRVHCHGWWTRYKEHTRGCFTQRVRDAFEL